MKKVKPYYEVNNFTLFHGNTFEILKSIKSLHFNSYY